MPTKAISIIGLILMLVFISSCGRSFYYPQGESYLDENWGKSYELAKKNQILNPEAGKNLDPVVGFDGQTAKTLQEKYRNLEPEKKQSPEFGVLTIKK